MIASQSDDEHGHDLLLRGVVHEIEVTALDLRPHTAYEVRPDDRLLMLRVFGSGVEATALLDREDCAALHAYLTRYVQCEYEGVWTDEVGTIPVCKAHGNNSRHDTLDPHRPCLTVDPYPLERTTEGPRQATTGRS